MLDQRSPSEIRDAVKAAKARKRADLIVGLSLSLVRGFVSVACGIVFWLASIDHVVGLWALIASTVIGFVVLRATADWWS